MEIINTFNPIMQKYGNKIGVFCGWLETFRCVWNDFFKQKYGLGVKCFLIQIRSAECYRYL